MLLEVKHLSKRFSGGTEVLKDVSFGVNEGDFIVISGKNGSGKSVLMRHLNGLYRPDSGEVLYRDEPIFKRIRMVRQKIGMVFQNSEHQIVSQTVREDVSFGPENLHMDRNGLQQHISQALESVGLLDKIDHSTHTLSGGEKRRLAIAGVLAMNPEIIVLDEPFSNLDFPGVQQVLRRILLLHRAGHTIICITHELDKILYHADRLILMDKGTIICDDIPEKVLKEAASHGIRIPGEVQTEPPALILERMSWLK